jgi:hypothetical protein
MTTHILYIALVASSGFILIIFTVLQQQNDWESEVSIVFIAYEWVWSGSSCGYISDSTDKTKQK